MTIGIVYEYVYVHNCVSFSWVNGVLSLSMHHKNMHRKLFLLIRAAQLCWEVLMLHKSQQLRYIFPIDLFICSCRLTAKFIIGFIHMPCHFIREPYQFLFSAINCIGTQCRVGVAAKNCWDVIFRACVCVCDFFFTVHSAATLRYYLVSINSLHFIRDTTMSLSLPSHNGWPSICIYFNCEHKLCMLRTAHACLLHIIIWGSDK